jgi:hypothetical protein
MWVCLMCEWGEGRGEVVVVGWNGGWGMGDIYMNNSHTNVSHWGGWLAAGWLADGWLAAGWLADGWLAGCMAAGWAVWLLTWEAMG